ncbi:hydroxypyruvate isomerase [Paraburkholderia sp. GAS42]|jgi:hydroxypyruvate isomerase
MGGGVAWKAVTIAYGPHFANLRGSNTLYGRVQGCNSLYDRRTKTRHAGGNTRDMPGYFLERQDDAQAICAEVGAANLQVQFDCYHCQIVEGDLAVKLRRDMARIGHIQIAGVPERHEPDIGEINYPYLFELIDSLGYEGWIGCEYRPRAGTSAGLGWLKAWLSRT